MREFDFIAKYLNPLAGFDLLDNDGVTLDVREGHRLVVSKDMIVEDTHFFGYDKPAMVARKALRVNLSDIASMGAKPTGFLLGLALPLRFKTEDWLRGFIYGLREDMSLYDMKLIGGDTTSSKALTISVTMFGELPQDSQPLSRKGASVGDIVCVSGTIGDAAWGLIQRKQSGSISGKPFNASLDTRYLLPEPRIQLGINIRNIASSCIDVSDGLVLNSDQLARASGVKIKLNVEDIPLSDDVRAIAQDSVLETAITGGDDYELLFTVSRSKCHVLPMIRTPITIIGEVVAGEIGVDLCKSDGSKMVVARDGYEHM